VVTAAGTASVLAGGVTMAIFWLGTLPVMVALGATVRQFTGAFGKRLPTITCVMLMGLGLFTIVNRSRLDPAALARRVSMAAFGQEAHQEPPCCNTHDR
jgi:hypothetical protein